MKAYGLEFTLKAGCSVACAYCPQNSILKAYRGQRQLSLGEFSHLLGTVPSDVEITFAGYAEPWLHPQATDFVQQAVEKGHPVEVFTTLKGMGVGDVDRLSQMPFQQFTVHLPSNDRSMNLKLDEGYLQVLRGLVESAIPARYVYYGYEPAPELASVLEKAPERDPLHDRAGHVSKGDKRWLRGRIQCAHFPVRHMVLPDGTVSLCCMDWSLRHVLGNLRDQSYEAILESAEMARVKRGWQFEDERILCRQCPKGFVSDQDLRARWHNSIKPRLGSFFSRAEGPQ